MNIVGINKRSYPAQPGHRVETMDETAAYAPGHHTLPNLLMRCDLMAVLTVGHVEEYAAYIGIGSDPMWVANHGDKLAEQEARIHFPSLPEGAAYRG
jgi:hypothetical protein